ncbi:MAG TPA: ATP-binding protein, partial [Candidatus Thermoplasmatota archaeon]|nr:ATP-binding protein [Candidatus Thermoplasmatota archaeon]
RLLQVLDTYLSCGLACAPSGGQVRLEVERGGGHALVSVACRGATLPQAQRERLFLPFPSEEEPTAPRVGSGLGLYMARGIIERHGGRVAVHEGDGLVLSFALPLDGPTAAPAALERAGAVGRTMR